MRESTETVNQWEMNMIAKAVQDSADWEVSAHNQEKRPTCQEQVREPTKVQTIMEAIWTILKT